MGSKTGEKIRQAILEEREALLRKGVEDKPRDSEMSTGKFDEDLRKAK